MSNIIVTGANQGIGYFLVKELLSRGNTVTVIDLETDKLAELKKDFPDRLLPFQGDIRSMENINSAAEASVKAFGELDIAVHNACMCTFKSLEETDMDTFRRVMDVNYFGTVRFTKAVLPRMKSGGRVILTSSGVGVTGFSDISPYASSKGAIEAFAKCMNIENENKGISFHIFHPPLCRTESASGLLIPEEFKSEPQNVGVGLAKNINKKSFIICHSFGMKLQTLSCYLFPIRTGKMMSAGAKRYAESLNK